MPIDLLRITDATASLANKVMLHRVSSFDWASTPAGPVDTWPEDIRSVSRTVLLSPAPTAVLIGRQGITLYNDAVRAAFGPDFEDALGKPVVEVLPHLADFYAKILADAFMGRASSFRDFPFDLRRKGERKKAWFDLDFTPIVDARGSVQGVLVACPETTVRVEALLDARTSHERLDLALEAGGLVGTWEVDFRTDTVRADERFARLHGVDPKCAKAGVDRKLLVAGIHAEDRDRVMAAFDQAKISGTYRCEHRVVGFDGTRWIVASGHVRHGPDMAPTSFAGTAIDVTEQVETAAALAESERRFRTYAETLPQIVYSWKADGSHSYVNHRWHEFIGLENGDPGG
jgi:PAS domain-containing protein